MHRRGSCVLMVFDSIMDTVMFNLFKVGVLRSPRPIDQWPTGGAPAGLRLGLCLTTRGAA